MTRILYLCLGWLMVAFGVVGAFMPLMPTTVFLILASWFFARSSPRLESWLLGHPRFGSTLRAWNESGAIPVGAKAMACVGMAIGFAVFLVGAHPDLWLALCVAGFFVASAAYVVSRPTPAKFALDQTKDNLPCC
ncbi:YbaN family protein [Hyphomicrobium sp. D-2]|uniref:YbaN family protein n=1 Tax=Hyphomicrobium sp. D-2 TaxID=3041621 RepID=UPI002458F65B|nr:YbaN family protein [Hyphomicrobium sp. D-2]MDH4983720.1 YbaN family protein [Hyphomicrobium sp. D-2]